MTPNVDARQLHLSPALTEDERDLVFRLRYRAYRATEGLPPHPSEQVRDALDDSPHARSYLLRDGDRIVGTIRSTVYRPGRDGHRLLMHDFWPDRTWPWLDAADVVAESSWLTTGPDLDEPHPLYLLRMFAAHNANAAAHGARYVVAVVARRHSLFYRRRMQMEPMSPPLEVPGMNVEAGVVVRLDYVTNIRLLEAEYPVVAVPSDEVRRLAVPTPNAMDTAA